MLRSTRSLSIMMKNHPSITRPVTHVLLSLALSSALQSAGLQSPHLVLRHDPIGSLTLTRPGREIPALRFQIPAKAKATTNDDTLTLTLPDGHSLHITLRADQPFALIRSTLANRSEKQTNIPAFRLPGATLDRSCDGNPLTIAGKSYARGLGLHAPSLAIAAMSCPGGEVASTPVKSSNQATSRT